MPTEPAAFTTLEPGRFADTRPIGETTDGRFRRDGRIAAGSTYQVDIAGRGDVPQDAAAVVINVTTVRSSAPGHVTVYPCTATVPSASSVNYLAGAVDPNEVIAKLSPTGALCFFSFAETDLIVDVVGFVPGDSAFVPLEPARFADSRAQDTIDGAFRDTGPVAAGSSWKIDIAGRGDVPDGAVTAVLNVTVAGATASGHITAYPCTGTPPTASHLNYFAGTTRPNELVVRLSDDGEICLYSHASTHLVVDVVGYLEQTPRFTSIAPVRYGDTRDEDTFDGRFRDTGPIAGGTSWEVPIAGRGDVPDDATLAVLNVTAVRPAGAGHLTVYPCTPEVPNASHVNYVPGGVRPNEVIAKLDDDGNVCVYTHATTHLLIDVTGHDG